MEEPIMKVLDCGTEAWYLPSKGEYSFHRIDGPAVTMKTGHKEWIMNGDPHRLDGPAIEMPACVDEEGDLVEASVEWWIHGKQLDTDEVEAWIKDNNIDLKTEIGQMAFKLRWT